MYSYLSSLGKIILPEKFFIKNRKLIFFIKEKIARYTFRRANAKPEYIQDDKLQYMQKKYKTSEEKAYKYDTYSVLVRGEERANEIISYIHPILGSDKKSYLELGCGDGMASVALAKKRNFVVGIDHVADRFDKRALDQGIDLLEMDAEDLKFPDENFNVVFSYNAFEHFSDPAAVLSEIIRVLKPGGVAYFNFGPLYHSIWGLHAYDSISFPYCQHLFSESRLNQYCENNDLATIDYKFVNKWRVTQYRELWKKNADLFNVVFCNEKIDLNGLDLIIRHPSCFKKETDYFDDLIVHSIEIMLRKHG